VRPGPRPGAPLTAPFAALVAESPFWAPSALGSTQGAASTTGPRCRIRGPPAPLPRYRMVTPRWSGCGNRRRRSIALSETRPVAHWMRRRTPGAVGSLTGV